jgi:replicative DNA helicase
LNTLSGGADPRNLGSDETVLRLLHESESMILGAILLEQNMIHQISLEPVHFTQTRNRIVFVAMKELQKKNVEINPVTLVEELQDQTENAGGVTYLLELAAHCPTVANLGYYEKIVMKYYELSLIRNSANHFLNDYTPESAQDLYKVLIDMHTEQRHDEETKESIIMELYESLYEERSGMPGVNTGFPALNGLTGGWKEGELIILAARPSMGKTALAIQLAWECTRDQGVSLLFSLEMSSKQIMQRLLSNVSDINMMKWHNPYKYLSKEEMPRMQEALNSVFKENLEFSDNGLISLLEIRQRILNLKHEHPTEPFLVVIDYLQLINVKERFDRHDLMIGHITKQLKSMAKEFGIPIILLSQLSRGVESRDDKRPRLSDLRDSGNIEQDADIVLFLYRDEYYNSAPEAGDVVEVKVAKNRNGPFGTVKLRFKKECGRFSGK